MHPILMLGALLGSLTPAFPVMAGPALSAREVLPSRELAVASFCIVPTGPEYYAFDLFATRNIPGTGLAIGRAEVAVSGASPFSIALGPDGSYVYDIHISLERMKPPGQGRLVAWVTTPEIDRIVRMGALDENLRSSGTVGWNKFIVVITLEREDDPTAATWSGPVVFRGMSRSGMMHTMVGHGALQQENCAAYGYGN
ncbi:MAG: hypothetical protein OEN56_00400 [Gemmatimonadota bacterium]|nr:hypothetical protein [Gemmatimonadota bacterium]